MKCPRCGKLLGYVQAPAYLNSDQWEAVSPGDYFTDFCPSDGECFGIKNSGSGYIYFRENRIKAAHDEEAARKGWE